MIRTGMLFLAAGLALAHQIATVQHDDASSEVPRVLSAPPREDRRAPRTSYLTLLRLQRTRARQALLQRRSDLERSAHLVAWATGSEDAPVSGAGADRLTLTQRSPEHIAFTLRSPEHLTADERANTEAAEQKTGGECSKCKDNAGCDVKFTCLRGKCVHLGAGQATSVGKCFPNLVECSFCFADAQCGLGQCHGNRCIRQKDDATLFSICGVRTAALTPKPWTPSWLGSQVQNRFHSFKHMFGY